ncbi:MAG: alpha-glucuronidase family glycosyl hydrolase [Saprospiraceae bacterium]|nr:alpha-glucuronidase family glycosyl hydrolase [Saprospiraceae bacterium]
MKKKAIFFLSLTLLVSSLEIKADDGYRLWLRYDLISNAAQRQAYRQAIQGYLIENESPTLSVAKNELQQGLNGLLGQAIPSVKTVQKNGIVVVATLGKSALLAQLDLKNRLEKLHPEGFLILNTSIKQKKVTLIAAKEDIGALYGVFHFLKLLQTHQNIEQLDIESAPKVKLRILNHWDNLDRTVERGYAGFSIWDWHKLPDYLDPRYTDYARANASIGINGTVLTNVNANALVLTPAYLEKVAALANVFRPYGIRVYLTARFSAPIEIGGLKTADPFDPQVQTWWKNKTNEIYQYVPDFGGFVVKANSEGQPGPQNYKRSHAEGANMLADALAPHQGIVMWRAFVYDNNVPDDRAKQAYNEFKPLDGTFKSNVMIQVKNGPIDFQPREPFHPMFGSMPKTPLMMEFQITQEYLGQATNLVYLAPMWKECLESDTYAKGQGSTVAKVIDGSLHNYSMTSMAGVANIGNEHNWTGHPFGQSNWYAFGRLAWDHELTSAQIAEEWIRMTFSNDDIVVKTLQNMMLNSHETVVKYSTPLGLHHIMGAGHHYGPGPWVKNMSRADWTSVYYHRADSLGLGFDRTSSGSDALSQYFPEVQTKFNSLEHCPESYLLWFHHVNWNHKMKSGQTLWEALCRQYYQGVEEVRQMQKKWNILEAKMDATRFSQVKALLKIQEKEAIWWRNSCVLYFQTFSRQAIPSGLEQPEKSLDYYQKLSFPYAPGIRPQW